MAAPRSPNTSSSILPQPKKSVFSAAIASTSRRQSMSNVPSNFSPHPLSQGIGFSPGPPQQTTTPTPAGPGSGTGIPSFKSLRSLLPFGPNKNATPNALTSTPPNPSKSPFPNFGSMRRSMQKDRDRKMSLSNDASPIIAIGHPNDAPVRRSVSLPRLEKPLPEEPPASSSHRESFLRNSLGDDGSRRSSAYTLRTPSPGPPLSAELSTIIEADNSGVSRHAPFFGMTSPPTPSRSSSPPIINRDLLHPEAPRSHDQASGPSKPEKAVNPSDFENEGETFALDLDTSQLADQVRNALRGEDGSPNSAKQWLNVDKGAIIIDTDDDEIAVGDKTFNMDPNDVDPSLAALLSPNSLTASKNGSSHSLQRSHGHSESAKTSPTTPTFQPSASPSSRLPRGRPASSFLPRLKSANMSPTPSPTSPRFVLPTPTSPTSNPVTPRASPAKPKTPIIAVNGHDYTPSSPTSPKTSPTLPGSSTPAKKASSNRFFSPTKLGLKPTPNGSLSTDANSNTTPKMGSPTNTRNRTLREVMLGVSRANSADSGSPATPSTSSLSPMVGRASLDARRPTPYQSTNEGIGLGRPSLELRRGGSYDSRLSSNSRAPTQPSPTSISGTADDFTTEPDSSPSPETQFTEPAMFHTPYRPSLDSVSTRPSLDAGSRPSSSAARLKQRERERDYSPRENLHPPRGPPPDRVRKRSMSVQERWGTPKAKPNAPGVAASEAGAPVSASRPGSSMSVHGSSGRRGVYNGFSASATDVNDLSPAGPGPKMEWLGPRTAKAFKAAGLLDFEKDREREGFDTPTEPRYYHRERSGSINGVLAPSPLGSGVNGSSGALNRFASMRSASEYNPSSNRAQSRMAFSEVAGPSGRRESGTFSQYAGSSYGPPGLMESPTFTASSGSRGGDRDTPRSGASTAPTSVSESFGYFSRSAGDRDYRERERERDREELRELKERHATEMGALLNALSDSQRTVRLLRDENSELRERLDRLEVVVRENNGLRQACGEMQLETTSLRRECAELRSQLVVAKTLTRSSTTAGALSVSRPSSGSSGLRTPIPRTGNGSPLARTFVPPVEDEKNLEQHQDNADTTIIIHDDVDNDQPLPQYLQRRKVEPDNKVDDSQRFSLEDLEPASSSTPSTKRRLSNTSSIFPIPPSNMTMLLHDDAHPNFGSSANSNHSSADHSFYPSSQAPFPPSSPISSRVINATTPTQSKAISFPRSQAQPNGFGDESMSNMFNKSVSSAVSISPTTANFSMATGSPGSLYLRPEHEVLLGDMESLDLGVRNIDLELDAGRMSDGW
ncbi:hypothetical protein CVT24_005162 [Panaeolus cyanescens]|uniref:Uncharacterized protein n=1 Tax=Panaeolus cyanescens TaxID=181874 RepID=A0A409Y9P9_9AGAR|nr:hypothetical protein CVT24_005162 [Panaeolus cyanescens]